MKIVIIGNGPAAISAIEAIRQFDMDCEITIISKEGEPAYTPCFLHRYVSGEIGKERLYMREDDFYDRKRIRTIFGVAVTEVMPMDNKLRLSDGRELTYDNLLMAAGSMPVIPKREGIEGEGVFAFRTISDADRILRSLKESKEAVVMGAGFIGLEIAEALSLMGATVTVVEKEDRILPRMLDGEIAEVVKRHVENKGARILTGRSIEAVKRTKNKIKGVMLDNGEIIPCGMLIVAAGVRPNLEMLKNGSIKTNQGILVDDHMRTNISNICAAGDIAEIEIGGTRKVNPIHLNAVKGGYIAGCNIVGLDTRLASHFEDMNVVTLFGLSVLSLGTQSGERVLKKRDSKGIVKVYLNEKGHIQGIQLLGDVTRGGVYLSLMRRGIPVADRPYTLSPYPNYGLVFAGIKTAR